MRGMRTPTFLDHQTNSVIRLVAATHRPTRQSSVTWRCSIILDSHMACWCKATRTASIIGCCSMRWRYPRWLRGVAITDTRIQPSTLRDWHRLGMRGLRFHLFSEVGRPGYVRGVGLEVFQVFRTALRELGWVVQVFCDWRLMEDLATTFRDIAREMPLIVDHMLHIPAGQGTQDRSFQALLRFVGEGHVYVKLSAPYRLSDRFPDYPDREV